MAEQEAKKEIYDPKEAEQRLQGFWEKEGVYRFDLKSKKKIYSIDTPPPTVSGNMHMGHAYSYTQQDVIARFRRMYGYNVFYPFGTDDNGLPTERLVEKMKGVKSKQMPRAEFIKLCLDTLKEIRPSFVADWKKMGISCDWNIFYTTIDDHSRKLAQWSFLDLQKKKRVYRKDAPAMWCPECMTGVAQVEVHDKELDSIFNDISFKIDGKDLTIATTRPELLPACAAIFYHPGDKRYEKYNGKKATVPLFGTKVPILPDERADPEKGTGAVMCCTFGDQTDMEWQKAHNLPIKMAITTDGKMTDLAGKYQGLAIKQARKEIIKDLKDAGLLAGQKPIKHAVNVHERCGTEIEFVKSKQWFVKYLDLRKEMLKWGEQIKWHPDHMKHRYSNWVNGLQWDWLISNQRHFGVPFPVWYCSECDEIIFADEKDLPVDPEKDSPPVKACPKCKSKKIIPEKDVFNTWFTSSLTPQIAMKLMPEAAQGKLFPMDLRPQAHDIITFWLFNTVIKSQIHFGKSPWKNAMISGFVLDPKGIKMSKSKGNVTEPKAILDKYSADALRFAACSTNLGEDMPFQEKELIAGQKTVNKLWNASKFVFMHIDKNPSVPKNLSAFDEWMLAKLNGLIKTATEHFENYEYSRVKSEAENFFWHVFSDDYLEIVKDRLYNEKRGKEEGNSARYVLYQSLLAQLKILAPIMPHITEELYQKYFKVNEKDKSIHLSEWPSSMKAKMETEKGDKAAEVIYIVRKFKSQNSKSLKTPVILTLEEKNKKALTPFLDDLQAVTSAQEIKWGKAFEVKFA